MIMNKIKTISFAVAASVLISSCTSYGQFGAGMTGAAIGSHIGRDVGYLAGIGHHHHFGGPSSALGSLIGAGIGAALGVGIQNSIERSHEKAATERYQRRQSTTSNDDYQYEGGSSNRRYNESYDNYPSERANDAEGTVMSNGYVSIEPLSYMDADGDGNLRKGETIEIQTYITNVSDKRLENVNITIQSSDSKYVTVSSPLFTSLAPGQRIKYTGRVYCQKSKSNSYTNIAVRVNAAGAAITTKSLAVYMK